MKTFRFEVPRGSIERRLLVRSLVTGLGHAQEEFGTRPRCRHVPNSAGYRGIKTLTSLSEEGSLNRK